MTHDDSRRTTVLSLVAIVLVGVACYANTFQVPFQFDDYGIADTRLLYARLARFFARSFADLTFALNHRLHGTSVFGFHLVNLAIHLATASTLFFLVRAFIAGMLTGNPHENGRAGTANTILGPFLPLGTALLFVAHPIQTQAVTYIAQRYTSLATLCYLGAVLCYVTARQRQAVHPGRTAWPLYCATAVAGTLAMLSKEIAITLPAALMLVELLLYRGQLLRNRLFFSLLLAFMVIVPAQHLIRHGASGLQDIAYTIDRSTREELTYSRSQYFITELRVVATYLRLMVLPVHQNLDYDYPLQKNLLSAPVLLSLLLHLAFLAGAVWFRIRSRAAFAAHNAPRGVCLGLAALGIAWWYLTLAVESSVIPIIDVIFEHRLYLPSAGLILACVSLAAIPVMETKRFRVMGWIVLGSLVAILGTATYLRNSVWRTEASLWTDTARKSPNKSRVLNNLATVYLKLHMPEQAVAPLVRATELQPGDADSLNNLGQLLDQLPTFRGRYNNGMAYLDSFYRVNMKYLNAWFANAQNNWGLVYEHMGNRGAAEKKFRMAVSLDPRHELAWGNLYLAAVAANDRETALEALEKLRAINPRRAELLTPHH